MFVGKHEVRLDSKNRVIVPQKMRESRGGGGPVWSEFFLTLGDEGCVFVYTPEGWALLMDAMGATKPLADESLRTLQRLVAANAVRCECDGAGRILLPAELRSHADLKRDVVWVGAVGRAEIWDKLRWRKYHEKHVSKLGEKLDIVSRAGLAVPRGVQDETNGKKSE